MYQEMLHEARQDARHGRVDPSPAPGGGQGSGPAGGSGAFSGPFGRVGGLAESLETLDREGHVDAGVLDGIRAAMDELQKRKARPSAPAFRGHWRLGNVVILGQPEDLRDMYRQTVLEFGTVNDVFAHILERHGEAGFERPWILFRALGNDLSSDAPSMDKTHLESVHASLGQVRLLQSAHTLCDAMLQRWENVHGVAGVRDGSEAHGSSWRDRGVTRNERFLGPMHIDRITARSKAPDISARFFSAGTADHGAFPIAAFRRRPGAHEGAGRRAGAR